MYNAVNRSINVEHVPFKSFPPEDFDLTIHSLGMLSHESAFSRAQIIVENLLLDVSVTFNLEDSYMLPNSSEEGVVINKCQNSFCVKNITCLGDDIPLEHVHEFVYEFFRTVVFSEKFYSEYRKMIETLKYFQLSNDLEDEEILQLFDCIFSCNYSSHSFSFDDSMIIK